MAYILGSQWAPNSPELSPYPRGGVDAGSDAAGFLGQILASNISKRRVAKEQRQYRKAVAGLLGIPEDSIPERAINQETYVDILKEKAKPGKEMALGDRLKMVALGMSDASVLSPQEQAPFLPKISGEYGGLMVTPPGQTGADVVNIGDRLREQLQSNDILRDVAGLPKRPQQDDQSDQFEEEIKRRIQANESLTPEMVDYYNAFMQSGYRDLPRNNGERFPMPVPSAGGVETATDPLAQQILNEYPDAFKGSDGNWYVKRNNQTYKLKIE